MSDTAGELRLPRYFSFEADWASLRYRAVDGSVVFSNRGPARAVLLELPVRFTAPVTQNSKLKTKN